MIQHEFQIGKSTVMNPSVNYLMEQIVICAQWIQVRAVLCGKSRGYADTRYRMTTGGLVPGQPITGQANVCQSRKNARKSIVAQFKWRRK